MVPARLAGRLDDLGIDFSVMYPLLGLVLCTLADTNLRAAACCALDIMNAELRRPRRARLAPAPVIPMHMPAQARETLDGAIVDLGLRWPLRRRRCPARSTPSGTRLRPSPR